LFASEPPHPTLNNNLSNYVTEPFNLIRQSITQECTNPAEPGEFFYQLAAAFSRSSSMHEVLQTTIPYSLPTDHVSL